MLNISRGRSIVHSLRQKRVMSATPRLNTGTSHVERTAAEPRDDSLHKVILGDIKQVNDRIRVLRLDIPRNSPPIKFLPGQWLDVHVPGILKPGGFTVTSTPLDARHKTVPASSSSSQTDQDLIQPGFLLLAVQKSPSNPPAAWLWRPVPEILNQELHIRVGGSFVWPPPYVNLNVVKRVVFVAGGVGINPLWSMISHLAQQHKLPYTISVLYSVRDPGDQGLASILFLESLAGTFASGAVKGGLVLHLTSGEKGSQSAEHSTVELAGWKMKCRRRRITMDDVLEALGGVDERESTVVYVCGVPTMTDELVDVAQKAPGMVPKKVLFERWW